MIRIIIVDDHSLFRRGLKVAFKYECTDIAIVGEAECGEELFDVLATTDADLVLLDINLPDMGGADIAPIMFAVYSSKKKTVEPTQEFTDRERDIILLCRDGLIVKEIADRLGLSINTIQTHKKNIFLKLGINNQMEMVQYALNRGII